jgi:hypothetical protein
LPNHTKLRAIVVADIGEDVAGFLVYERPIIAWRIDLMSEDGEFTDPVVYGDTPASNEAMCIYDPDTGQAWIPSDEMFATRELAVEGMQACLIRRRERALVQM